MSNTSKARTEAIPHLTVHLSREHEANLRKLGNFLIGEGNVKAVKFSMNHWVCVPSRVHRALKHKFEQKGMVSPLGDVMFPQPHMAKEALNICGTAGCALGWAPVAGIEPEDGDTWSEYMHRCFIGSALFDDSTDAFSDVEKWCFAGEWEEWDNTPVGAGKRILYMLDHGLPITSYFFGRSNLIELYSNYTP